MLKASTLFFPLLDDDTPEVLAERARRGAEWRAQQPTFEIEAATFERHRASWVVDGRIGQYAVIVGDRLVGFFPDLAKVCEVGKIATAATGKPYFAKQVFARDPPVFVGGFRLR